MEKHKLLLDLSIFQNYGILIDPTDCRRLKDIMHNSQVYVPCEGEVHRDGPGYNVRFTPITPVLQVLERMSGGYQHRYIMDYYGKTFNLMVTSHSSEDIIVIDRHNENLIDYYMHVCDIWMGVISGKRVKMMPPHEFIKQREIASLSNECMRQEMALNHHGTMHHSVMRGGWRPDSDILDNIDFGPDEEKPLHEDILIVKSDKEVKNFNIEFTL